MRRWLRRTPSDASWVLPAAVTPDARPPPPDPRIEVLLTEWQELRASTRQCADQLYAQLRAFLASQALLAAAVLVQAGRPGVLGTWAPWVLPLLGMGLAGLFLGLTRTLLVQAQGLEQRGLQIEAALQLLLPGVGHVSSLGLFSHPASGESQWRSSTGWLTGSACGASGLIWAAVLASAWWR